MADYNQCRADFGLPRKRNFKDITPDPDTCDRLAHAYGGDLNQIDPWVGGLAEEHYPGAQVGEFFYFVLRDQFTRLRDGDRFWYANDRAHTDDDKGVLAQTTLASVIQRNTNVTFQPERNVFRLPLEDAS